MAVLWLCCGCAMAVLWLCCGCAVAVLWLCYGCAVVVLWLCYGCAMVVLWLCYGCAMAVLWVHICKQLLCSTLMCCMHIKYVNWSAGWTNWLHVVVYIQSFNDIKPQLHTWLQNESGRFSSEFLWHIGRETQCWCHACDVQCVVGTRYHIMNVRAYSMYIGACSNM